MASFIGADVIGHLGQDAEGAYTSDGKPYLKMSVAVQRLRKQGQEQPPLWVRATMWGPRVEKLFELMNKGALMKGDPVFLQGRPDMEEYTTQSGEVRTSFTLNVDELVLLKGRTDD